MSPQRGQRKRTKTGVYDLTEGGFMVRGTDDPAEALLIAINARPLALEDLIDVLRPEVFESTGFIDEDRENFTSNAAHAFQRWLRNPITGWLRFSPCHSLCGEHHWHWDTANGPGRGVFKGVIFE